MADDEPDRGSPRFAPEGASCAEHPERPAFVTCPRCGSYCCLECWHRGVEICDPCLRRDPLAAAPPIPWENASLGFFRRLLGTLGSAFRPTTSAPAFAREDVRPALTFALAVALPLAALSGVIPITKTLQFGPSFSVRPIGDPTTEGIALDVLRAMGIAIGLTILSFAALTLPYVSLARAYGGPLGRPAALRTMLYRAWLLPLGANGIPFGFFFWALPAWAGVAEIAYASVIVPLILIWVTMHRSARMAAGARPLPALAVVLVPFVLFMMVQMATAEALERILPRPPDAEAPAE